MIPGLENADFARYGVMHRNTFINAPMLLNQSMRLVDKGIGSSKISALSVPVFIAGQLSGTEGYCEAIATGLFSSLNISALFEGIDLKPLPYHSALGSLLYYATNDETVDYQPMHVNFGIFEPIEPKIRNKQARYTAYAERGFKAIQEYGVYLDQLGLANEKTKERLFQNSFNRD